MKPESLSPSPVPGVITLDAPAPPAPIAARPPSLLDRAIEATPATLERSASALDGFLKEPAPIAALMSWLGSVPSLPGAALKQHVAARLNRDIARIDSLVNDQVNAILHHADFQKLEASWRSLRGLIDQAEGAKDVIIKVLNVSWKELTKDITRASEFDQSELFRKVYSEQFGMPGGKPFGVLLGDYEIRHRMTPDHPYNDIETLSAVSEVAAAAFAPFVAAAHPSLLDLESFTELERSLNLSESFRQLEYLKWKAFRKKDEARFVGLTIPRVLARLPYTDDSGRADGFRFSEDLGSPDRRNYLWGNAAYAFVGVLIRAFIDTGWLADIRGVRRGQLSGGVVAGVNVHHFATDSPGIAPKCPTDTIITDTQEKELGGFGFIPLCYCQDTELSAFYGNQSVQEPKEFSELSATVNARMSGMLQYILCASRFAHYVKVMIRDHVGSFGSAFDVQSLLHRWLQRYTSGTPEPQHPLKRGEVEVVETQPGKYSCRMFFQPHYQLDQLVSVLRLDSVLAPSEKG